MYISFLCNSTVIGAAQKTATPKNFYTSHTLICSDALVE